MKIGYHIIAFIAGFILDLLFGDPYWLPHPIRLIGKLIAVLDQKLLGENTKKYAFFRGIVLVITVTGSTVFVAAAVLFVAYRLHPAAGVIAESIMTYQILAAKCLKVESMKVYDALQSGDLAASRKAVSMIVGRDTEALDEAGVAKAAIETVAENTSDGVIAPMLYTALGGPVLGFFYKAVNTMDSMVGYKNDRYLYFGRAAAKLDDIVNFIPARVSAWFMIASCLLAGKDVRKGENRGTVCRRAYQAWKTYRFCHASPNSAQTESVCAGALGLQLAGDAWYFGKPVKKPYIGDAVYPVETEDIKRANKLMYLTAGLCEMICVLILIFVFAVHES